MKDYLEATMLSEESCVLPESEKQDKNETPEKVPVSMNNFLQLKYDTTDTQDLIKECE